MTRSGTKRVNVAGFDRRPVFRVVRSSRSSLAAGSSPESEAAGPCRTGSGLGPRCEAVSQMVLGRAPDPADVPPDSRGLLAGRPEMHLLDERPIGVGDEQPEARIASDERAYGRGGKLCGAIVRVTLAPILQPNRNTRGTPAAAQAAASACISLPDGSMP